MNVAQLNEAGRSLLRQRNKYAFAVLSIAVGIAAVIAMVSAGRMAARETLRQFEAVGTDYFTIGINDLKKVGTVDPATVAGFLRRLPSVESLVPFISGNGNAQIGSRQTGVTVIGAEESFGVVNRIKLQAGRFVHASDRSSSFCVLGADLVEGLGFNVVTDAIGRSVRIAGVNHVIIGVLAPHVGGVVVPFNLNGSVIIPFSEARRLFSANPPNTLLGRVKPGVEISRMGEEIGTYFSLFHRNTSVSVSTAEQAMARLESQARIFTVLLGSVAALALVIGGVGVMNTMLLAVAERRVEIGLRRALGAEQAQIRRQFFFEAGLLCSLGGVLGLGLGTAVAWGVARFAGWGFTLSIDGILVASVVSLTAGLLFGYLPARNAAQLEIADAIR